MILKVIDLYKNYGQKKILNGVSLTINKGDVVTIIGKSGSGKTTLLRCLNLLVEPDKGTILFDGTEITNKETQIDQVRKQMGMVFQSFNLFNNLNVLDNCTLALKNVLKMSKELAEEKALFYLKKV